MSSSSIPVMPFMALAFLIILFVLAPASDAKITCNDVLKDMKPCITYLKSGSGLPPSPCCTGASNLASTATSSEDKQTACTCMKNASKNINVKPELAKSLPGNCGISLPFEVSPNVDCSKVS